MYVKVYEWMRDKKIESFPHPRGPGPQGQSLPEDRLEESLVETVALSSEMKMVLKSAMCLWTPTSYFLGFPSLGNSNALLFIFIFDEAKTPTVLPVAWFASPRGTNTRMLYWYRQMGRFHDDV